MAKSILLSIRPEHVANILNGRKTIEIRKTAPKLTGPITVYIYCTKTKYGLVKLNEVWRKHYHIEYDIEDGCKFSHLNGMIVAKFKLNRIDQYINGCKCDKTNPEFNDYLKHNLLDKACLTQDELENYAPDLSFYVWHISDLKILNEPIYINEFYKWKEPSIEINNRPLRFHISIRRPPQSYMFVGRFKKEELE